MIEPLGEYHWINPDAVALVYKELWQNKDRVVIRFTDGSTQALPPTIHIQTVVEAIRESRPQLELHFH